MVGQAIQQTASTARGPRPFDPTRDLHAVAHLLEESFRSEHTFPFSDLPILRELGVLLWTLSYAPVFPDNISGFVWLEDGQIVGNVTLSVDEPRGDRFLISNVAVKPSYQRRGIARALMQTTLQYLRERHAKRALLNVRPNNAGAIRLYRNLGFGEVDIRGEWKRAAHPSPTSPSSGSTGIGFRPLHPPDRHSISTLVRAAMPSYSYRIPSPYTTDFQFDSADRLLESLADMASLQVTERWGLEQEDQLVALLTVRAHQWGPAHRLEILVHPGRRGRIEEDLVEFGLQRLARWHSHEIQALVTSAYPDLTEALERNGFRFVNGLMLMALEL